MNYEILIVLFLLLSVISTLINKFQEHRRNQMPEDRPVRRRPPDLYDLDEEDVELSDWLGNQPAEMGEEIPNGHPSEFQPVQGKRSVEERDTGEEFQEVEGKRSVEETYTGVEFRPVGGPHKVAESTIEIAQPPEQEGMWSRMRRTKKRSKRAIVLSPKALRQAIIYNEIIGPPLSERMPE